MYTEPMLLTWPLHKVRGCGASDENDLFGIEIELEGKNIMYPASDKNFNKFWEAVPDGSLKAVNPGDQTIEYRSSHPLTLKETEKSLELLEYWLTRPGVTVYDSGRASVHVHVNCNNETMSTIYNYLTISCIFDELLVSQNGAQRVGNNFCLRAKDAEGLLVDLSESVRKYGHINNIKLDNRYSSINPMSLFKFGTVEFRSMECTINRDRLVHWVKTLLAMKNAAKKFANPTEIISHFSSVGPERFFLNVLGPQALKYIKVADRHGMLFRGIRLVQEFAHSATWEPAKDVPKPVTKSKKMSTIADFESSMASYIQSQQNVNAAQPWPTTISPSGLGNWAAPPPPPQEPMYAIAPESDDDDSDIEIEDDF